MNLRIVTLLVAITQCLYVASALMNFIVTLNRVGVRIGWQYFALQPVYLLSHIVLTIFFFALFARQKPSREG